MLIFDNLHGYIQISDKAKKIIDTTEFQRLKNIHQTGALYYVWPTAVHSRFEHSIGTYYLTGLMLEKINTDQPELKLTKELIELVKLGGLCHDLGHCTYSHTFDDIVLKSLPFYNELGEEKYHEYRSIILLRYIIKKYDINISEQERKIIEDVIYPEKNDYYNWPEKYKIGQFILDIVCNKKNNIDVDKFDYISRDNLAIGLKLGFDYSRLIQFARVIDDTICYPKKIMEDIYHLFFVRYRLYKQIYTHKTVISIDLMLSDILINYIHQTNFLNKESLKDPEKLILLTDHIFYLIKIMNFSKSIFNRIESRNLYTFLGEFINDPNDKIVVDKLQLQKYLQKNNSNIEIKSEDIIVKQYKVGYVSGNNLNPLDNIYYFENNNNQKIKADKLNISFEIKAETYQELVTKIYYKGENKINKNISNFSI